MKKYIAIFAAAALSLAALPAAACSGKTEKKTHYQLECEYDPSASALRGEMTFTYCNDTDNEIDALSFNLWGNAYREGAKYKPVNDAAASKAYYDGVSYGGETVEKVEGCAEWEICGEDENILKVTLGGPLYPDESCTVTVNYTLNLAKINHRTGVTETTVNLGNFYPALCAYNEEGFVEAPYYSCGDPFVSECADYDVKLTLPKEYVAATSGKEVEKKSEGSKITYSYQLNNARDFACVLSTEFKVSEQTVDGTAVKMYYIGDTAPEKQMKAACESLTYFNGQFGQYAYPTLSIVLTPLAVSGMEYPALTMINSTLEEADGVYTVVHENAHQWWYAMVGSDQLNCAFMDEGLAEYSGLCFFEKHPDYGFTRTGMLGTAIKSYRAYYSVYNQIFGKADTEMTRSLGEYASDYEYINVAYNKGLLMFESVRQAMGDKKFFAALESYFDANCFKIATPPELISHFAKLYDVEGIFNSYIDGKVVI